MTETNINAAASLNSCQVRCLAIVLAELQSGYGGEQEGDSSGRMRGGNRLLRCDGDSTGWSPERSVAHGRRMRRPRQLPEVVRKDGEYFNQVSSKSGQGSAEKNFADGRHLSAPGSGISVAHGWH